MKGKKVTVVMSGTADYAFAIGNVLMGLTRHSPGLADEAVIYHQGFSVADRAALEAIRPCRFIEYRAEGLAGYVESDHFRRVTSATFASFEMFDHLEDSNYVIYLDADLLIYRDISGLIDYARPLAMHLFTKGVPGVLEEQLGANHEGRPLPDFEGNAGVIVVSDRIDRRGLKELMYKKAVEYSPTNKRGDQTIFNLGLFLQGIEICDLPPEYNYFGFYLPINPEVRILHQVHLEKFWNNALVKLMAPQWAENYQRWLELGGSPYQGEVRFEEFVAMGQAPYFKLAAAARIYRAALHDLLSRWGRRLADRFGFEFRVDNYCLSLSGQGRAAEIHMFDKYVTISAEGENAAKAGELWAQRRGDGEFFTRAKPARLCWRGPLREDVFAEEKMATYCRILEEALQAADRQN